MKYITLLAIFLFASPAGAQMVEAKAVAQTVNCKPAKVVTLRQRTGSFGETLYEVTCQGAEKGKEEKVKVMCRGKLCDALK